MARKSRDIYLAVKVENDPSLFPFQHIERIFSFSSFHQTIEVNSRGKMKIKRGKYLHDKRKSLLKKWTTQNEDSIKS